jgi:spore coat polysaccharide biosynthesis predicted glycosyltransferase SpsG
MTNIPHIIGQGDCHRCNKLADDLEELRREYLVMETSLKQIVQKVESDAINWMVERGRMQDTIDELRREKNDALCRCQGWDTKGMGE